MKRTDIGHGIYLDHTDPHHPVLFTSNGITESNLIYLDTQCMKTLVRVLTKILNPD